MNALEPLGVATVEDAELLRLVARQLGRPESEISITAAEVRTADYALDSITTAARHWVEGSAATPVGERPFRFYVKVVRSWRHSPFFAMVPEPLRESAAAGVPWRTEPWIYESDLAQRLPDGLRMAQARAVHWLPEETAAIWLDPVATRTHDWSDADLAHAARLLGRFAAHSGVRELVANVPDRVGVRGYVESRVRHAIAPPLRDPGFWRHPALTAFDEDLRADLVRHLGALDSCVAELESFPELAAHGDACTNNLLVTDDSEAVTLIDFGFTSPQPVGFDLAQLVLGEIHMGRRRADAFAAIEASCLEAYVAGLADEGLRIPLPDVVRAHALQMLLYAGLSTAVDLAMRPFEPAADPDAHEGAERAAVTRACLDLVAATA